MTRFHTLAALAAITLTTPVFAAPSPTLANADGGGKTVILSPLNFINDTDLNFGDVVLPTGSSGSVTIDPDPTVTTFMSAIGVQPIPTSVPTRGLMIGAGTALSDVVVTTAFPSKLYLNGDTTSLVNLDVSLTVDAAPTAPDTYTYTIDSGQVFQVHVGGRVDIPAGTSNGSYSNTYDVTATYP